jgi:hypothetical protein
MRATLYLQVFIEWRDPDSNRGHHDFQWRAPCLLVFSAVRKVPANSVNWRRGCFSLFTCVRGYVGVQIGVLHAVSRRTDTRRLAVG